MNDITKESSNANAPITSNQMSEGRLAEARRRYRNFRFSIPITDFNNRREAILKIWEKNTVFIMGQEEISPNGHHHLELFATMNNSNYFIC